MNFTRRQFQEWGAQGGRMRARRLSKARRKQIAKGAGSVPKRGRGRPVGSKNKTHCAKVDIPDAISLYRSGRTLREIGEKYGVTREWIRQLLKIEGMTREDGGQSIKTFLNVPAKIREKNKKIEKRERSCLKRWGLSLENFDAIAAKYGTNSQERSPFRRYSYQRRNAAIRKIEWRITFAEWWKIWQESGKYHLYGRGQNTYCMSRYGDSGAYTPANVNIILSVENNSDRLNKRSGLPMGVAKVNNRFKANKMIGGVHYHVGTYATIEQASAAYQSFKPKRKRHAK